MIIVTPNARQHTAHPACRIWHITPIAGNQMDMDMHPRLPCGLSDIHPDVVSVGRMLGAYELVSPAKKLENRDLFLRCHFEEVRHVTLRNRYDVARTQRMVVRAHIGQFVLGQDGCGRAELAFLTLFHRCPFRAA